MTAMPASSSLSILKILDDFVSASHGERVVVRDFINATAEHGLLFILLVFALFCAIPLPIPGIHVFLSMPLYYVTVQQMMGRRTIWFPDRILNATLPREGFIALITRARPWFARIDHYVFPRLTRLIHGPGYRIMGAVSFFITCIIVIPLPLTNVVPALAIATIALAMLCHDGLVMLIGAFVGLLWCFAWIALAVIIGWAGMQGIYGLVFG